MKRILLTTLILTLLGCLLAGFLALFSEVSFQAFLYTAILTFGSIIIPTHIGVLAFHIVKKRVILYNWMATYILQVFVMVSIITIGLILWAIGDVLMSSDQLTLERVKDVFYSQFSGFAIAGIFMAIAMPFVDHFLTKKELVNPDLTHRTSRNES